MADVTVKMGVSGVNQFKSSMQDAQASVKTFDAAMKANEKQLKATGDAEKYMEAQTTLLNGKLKAQKEIVKNAEQALKQMEQNGVKTTSKSFQEMQRKLIEAQSSIIDTEMQMESLGTKAQEASTKTTKLGDSLGGLNKKVSLEQVGSVIDRISGGLEKGAKKAAELGKAIWENITDVARFSDDTATQAMILDMDVESYQAYKKVFDTTAELTVQEWQKAKQKVQKAIHEPTDDQTNLLELLGIQTHDIEYGKMGAVEGAARDFEDVFWEIGETLKRKVESGELTQDLADTYANALFGKSFANLKPIFDMGADAFEQEVKDQKTASEEAIKANAELNDKLTKLKGDFETLKVEVVGGLAPALTKGTEALDSLLGKVLEYLDSEEGKKALADMGTAVSGLFDDLGKIDPEKVVEGLTGIFEKIIGGLQWLVDHKSEVEGTLIGIVGAWGAMQIGSGIISILKLIDGLRDLGVIGGGAAGAASGGSGGGLLGGGLMAGISAKVSGLLPGIQSWISTNGGPVIDWLTNESELAPVFKGNESIGDWFARKQSEVEHNAETFSEDWKNNAIVKWVQNAWDEIGKVYENQGNYWVNQNKIQVEAEQYNLGDHASIEESLAAIMADEHPEVVVDPKAPDNAAEQLSDEIGTVSVPVVYVPTNGETIQKIRTPSGIGWHANGLPYVPFDGYMAVLHKGEQVVPAREVSSRNYSSNLYVEKMIMNNGTDAKGLADAIAASNRRTMKGYGS